MDRPHYNRELLVRPVEGEELANARLIAARAFNENAETWYTGEVLAGFDADGTMVCALDFEPASLWWGTSQIPAGAIGGVAADPKHQGRGHAGGLMVQTINHLRDQGRSVCPLWPFSFNWYGKFGWSCPATYTTLKVWPDLVRQIDAPAGTVRSAESGDIPEIDRLYTAGAHTRNCQSVRPHSLWQQERWLGKVQVLVDDDGGLACSALVRTRSRDRGQGKRLVVQELHGTSFAAQSALLRSLAEMEGVALMDLELPPDSLLLHAFAERFDISCEHELALRVLDVPQALSHLHPPQDLQASISFEVADWVVNAERPLKVTARAEGGGVEILDRHDKDPLRCDINTFTQLFSGGLSVTQAKELNRLDGGTPAMGEACDALLHGRTPYRSAAEPG
ncbi:MAG TPA: GNAT family N-acetyltransferase [Candidatus Latescibacteria bacterium]|jgi:predicted acetyltransferase|nr:hypothetical protein [Gemmatimonadaceae bacterium]MDP6015165.1 GNAT family N-acetyltransferase [Candidatus Latescibacterota bacterium]HJP33049.1 GNAT family N-acetyltransferase [Candidatus Latescibacterota bacterium]